MQLLARLMDHVLSRRGERITLIAATSGDTGGAAVEAFAGRKNIDLFVLFPEGRVSPFQQRQMTTTDAANVHALAVKGTFDDCQAMVKAAFNNRDIRAPPGCDRCQLDQLGADRRPGRLLLHRRRRPRRAARPGRLQRAHRKLRRCLCGLCREADGAADRQADRRHQRQRHPGPHARHRPLRDPRRARDHVAVDGHPDLLQLRAAAVRGLWTRCALRFAG